ncbi:MAG: transposase, partial [Desulfurobacterium sp.]
MKRAFVFELNHLTEEQEIILGYLTYHAGRLWNQANYLIKNKLAKPFYPDLYNKLKDTSIHLRSLQSRSAQIVLDELSRGWINFFNFLENPEKFKKKGINIVRPPKYVNPENPHRVVTWDKTGFRIEGSRIRLSLSRSLKKHLLEKF